MCAGANRLIDFQRTNQIHLDYLYSYSWTEHLCPDFHWWRPRDAQTVAVELLYSSPSCSIHNALLTIHPSDRLENEHLGNMDQYRVTREVPLPYSFDDAMREDDADDDNDEARLPLKKR